jgi:hypothetical protein
MLRNLLLAIIIVSLFASNALTQSTPLSIDSIKAIKDPNGNLSVSWTTNIIAPVAASISFFTSTIPSPTDKRVAETSIPLGTQHSINVAANEIPSSFLFIRIHYYFVSEDIGTYKDILNSEITYETTPQPNDGTSQTINLKQGFNFISFTINPNVNASSLKYQDPAISDIYLYSSASGSFLSVADGTLTNLSAGKGYIIKSNSDKTITITGTSVGTIGNISLKQGFNLIGFSKAISLNTKFSDLMKSSNSIRGIYKWSPNAGTFIQVVKNPNGSPQLLDGHDPSLAIGQSYFFNTDSDTTLNYDNGSIVISETSSLLKSDLIIKNLAVNPTSSSSGSIVNVTFTIHNQGSGVAYASTATIRLSSSNTNINTSDLLLSSISVPSIAPGSSQNFGQNFLIPNTTDGNYYIWVIADTGSTANQLNETNDKSNTSFTITNISYSINNLVVSNTSMYFKINPVPTVPPVASDFLIKTIINGGAEQLTNVYSLTSSANDVWLNVLATPTTNVAQNVSYCVSYKNCPTASASFSIPASVTSGGTTIKLVQVNNGLLNLEIIPPPATLPLVSDFVIKAKIDNNNEIPIQITSILEPSLLPTIIFQPINVTDVPQTVIYTISYKGSSYLTSV